MDKNSIIGLGIIGVILVTFTLLNRPSEDELKKQQEKAKKEKIVEEKEEKEEQTQTKNLAAKETSKDTTSSLIKDTVKAQTLRLESNKLIVDINTLGGNIEAVYLKDYESYRHFKLNDKQIKALKLF
ncbi:MAG: hypothetical protein HYU67_02010 [Flavobacteriia bacterium]|nr:hypothetical protein [Flavobacteriia bacterium]